MHRPAIRRVRPNLNNRNRDHLKQQATTAFPATKKKTSAEKTVIFDTVTVVTAEENTKITSPPVSSAISNKVTNTFDHTTAYDTKPTTTSGYESFWKDITSKPRIVGGHAASFTVESNSDAFLPCEATGYPEPAISWKRFSPNTGTHIQNIYNISLGHKDCNFLHLISLCPF